MQYSPWMVRLITGLRKKKVKILIAAGGLILLAALGVAAFFFFTPRAGQILPTLPEGIFRENSAGSQALLISPEDEYGIEAMFTKNNGEVRAMKKRELLFLHYESSDESIISVDPDGTLHALSDGEATITARWFKQEVTLPLISYTRLLGISTDQDAYEVEVGKTVKAEILRTPENGRFIDPPVFTTYSRGIAAVDENGVITGVEKGTTTLHIRLDQYALSLPVRVIIPLTGISFREAEVSMKIDRKRRLRFDLEPYNANAPQKVRYSVSNDKIASISDDGIIAPVKPGLVTVTANADGFIAKMNVRILSPLKGIRFSEEETELVGLGTSERLKLVYEPEDTTDDKTAVYWSSDEGVAVVDQKGNVTSTGPGKCDIFAKVGEFTAVNHINVRIPLEAIAFSFDHLTIHYGDTVIFPLYYIPDNTTDDRTAEWSSSNPAAATVDQNGAVTAVGAGDTTITAKVGAFTASTQVTADIPVTGVAISQTALTLNKGTSGQLSASCIPANTTEVPYITWSSDNTKVAKVDANGKVTAVGPGRATITANHDLIGATCVVTVLSPLTGISIPPALTLIETFSAKPDVTLEPADTTENPAISWRSDNTAVAKVSADGTVKAVKRGSCNIIASVPGRFEAVMKVTVVPFVEVTGISLDRTSITFEKSGQTAKLKATIQPANASVPTPAWSTSNKKVATVDGNGKVTACGSGTCTITAKAGNKMAKCTVTVLQANRVVVLDPGHCDAFPGASYHGLMEAVINLKTAKYCKEYLESHYNGVTVYMTRTNGANLGATLGADLEARAQFAQDKGADILVSLHYNATAAHNASGCLAFVSYQPNVASQCQALGNQILSRISAMGLTNHGCISTASNQYFDQFGNPLDYYAINRHSANRGIPGIIVEHCFMDTDVAFIDSDAKLKKMGIADAQGIAAYLGLSAK